jgi:hypothetical protein
MTVAQPGDRSLGPVGRVRSQLLRLPEAATARRLDADAHHRRQLRGHLRPDRLAVDQVAAGGAVLAAGQPPWRVAASLRQERDGGVSLQADGPDQAIAAGASARTARGPADGSWPVRMTVGVSGTPPPLSLRGWWSPANRQRVRCPTGGAAAGV